MSWRDERNKNSPVVVKRRTEAEVERGIQDLLARGYEVIQRGRVNDADQGYSEKRTRYLTSNINSSRNKKLEPVDTVQFYATLKRT